jgi:Tfp pilus assembly protein PilO
LTRRQQLDQFGAMLPAEQALTAQLAQLQALAAQHALRFDSAEFKLSSEPGDPVLRYSMNLPLKADYGALRGFVRDVLVAMPGLALEEFSVRRADARTPLLEARLRLSLFVTAAPSGGH